MKTSKLLISSLLAAAAMSAVPAFGFSKVTVATTDGVATVTNTSSQTNQDTIYLNDEEADSNITSYVFNLSGGFFSATASGSAGTNNRTQRITKDVVIQNLTINNGYSNSYAEFAGAVSGSGNIAITAANGQDLLFTGDVSQFSGNITYSGALLETGGNQDLGSYAGTLGETGNKNVGIIQFGGAKAYDSAGTTAVSKTAISGTGEISTASVLRYNFAAESDGAALTVTNSSISARYLEFKGGANYTVSSTVTGNDATAANNTLKISAGTTTFTGAVSNFGNVTVASGATLAVGTGGSLNLSGTRVTLASAITNSGTVTLSGTTVFALDNLTATNGTYSLITGNSVADVSGVSFTRDGSAIKSSRLSVSTASGYAVTVTNYSDLVWAGTAENSVWNTTAENWSSTTAGDSVAFENRDSVTFGTNAGVSKIVSVASVVVANSVTVSDSYEFAFSNNGSVTASTMSIADGKTLTLSGTGTLTTGAVSGGGNLTVGAGTEATFTAANTLSGSMTLDGTLNLNNSVLSVSENTNTATISALSSLTGFSGSGRLVLDITGKGAAKNVDFSPVSGFTGTLVVKGASRMNLLGETGSLNAINQFAGIEVQSGAQLYLSAWTGEGTRVSNLSRTLTIAGAGYGSGTEAAALRMADNATLSGQLILSGNATVYSATGTQTISGGISAAGKTLTINGANILNISGTADITIGTLTLNKSGDTNLSATGTTTITTLNQTAGTLNITGTAAKNITTATISNNATTMNVSGTATFGSLTQNAGTLTIGGATTVTGNYQGSSGTDKYSVLTVNAGASLSVGGNLTLRQVNNNDTGATMNVSGEVSVGGNFWIARDGKGIVNINDGGTVVANTLTFGQAWDGASTKGSTVNLEEGGTLVVGTVVANTTAEGTSTPALNASALNLKGGTLGTSEESLTIDVTKGSEALSVVLGTGTTSTINTGKYDTAMKTFTNTATEIVINNVISGDGALKKTGAGKLTLSNANIYTGGTVIEEGTVVAANANALGTTKGVEVKTDATLKLGTSAVTVAGLSGAGTVGLASGTTSSTLTVNGGGVFTGTLTNVSLVKQGADSTLELSNTGSIISSAVVESGTLKFSPGISDMNTSWVTVDTVSVSDGAKLEIAPNSSAAVSYGLYATSGVTFAAGSKLVVDLTGVEVDVALSIITSSAIKYNTGTEELTLGAGNLDAFVNDFVTLKGWDGLADWSYTANTLSVTLTVPEPSAFGLLAGAGALALVAARRRRRKKA